MDERHRAEEHLRIIRTLMERATIYRAISAPTLNVDWDALLRDLESTTARLNQIFLR